MFFTNHHLCTLPHFKLIKFAAADFPCDDDDADGDAMKVSQCHLKPQINRDGDHKVELVMDLPGVKAAGLDVQVKDQILSVCGKRLVSNSQTLAFSRQFQLDTSNVDPSTIKANLVDGVLTVTAQKVKKVVDNLMKIAMTANPIILATAAEEEQMVETANATEASQCICMC